MFNPYHLELGFKRFIHNTTKMDTLVSSLETEIKLLPWSQRTEQLNSAFKICLENNELDSAASVLGLYAYGLVDEGIIERSNMYLRARLATGWTLRASFDPSYAPLEKEIVIYYGNYPHSVECLPATQKVYRHPCYFDKVEHTTVDFHSSWEPIERIYILTTESRIDRYFHILLELCHVGAPLHRIHKHCGGFTAYTGNPSQDKYTCASKNHADVAADFVDHGYGSCLVLEDDFSFISDVPCVHNTLAAFFPFSDAHRDFYVCFLSHSKQDLVEDCDDLISINKQACTTSSGYLLQKSTAHIIRDCQYEGVEAMKRGEDPGIYCCDRYWAKYNSDGKMLCFKRKLGFQYVTHSDIVNNANIHFD
jgi:hypothetical protein